MIAERVFANPRYVLDMSIFHMPVSDEDERKDLELPRQGCAVCFAGACIAGRLGADPDSDDVGPDSYPGDEDQLYALDRVRSGNVHGYLVRLKGASLTPAEARLAADVTEAATNGELYINQPKPGTKGVKWLRKMRKIARLLEERGL